MKKVNWEKVGDFIMKAIAVVMGTFLVYIATKIAIGIITAIYAVLIK